MSIDPGKGTSRYTPPFLLPSTSLGGLEQFVPPGPPVQPTLRQSWRFKPLPQLPSEVSSVYSRSCDEEKYSIGFHRPSNSAPVSAQWLDNQQPFIDDEQSTLEDTSQSNFQYFGQNQVAGGGDVQTSTAKRPTSHDRTGRWSPFPAQRQNPRPHPRAKRDSANSQRTLRDKSRVRSTGDLTHKSLVPAPLDVENCRQRSPNRDSFHGLRAPASADFDQYRSSNPYRHVPRTVPGPEGCDGCNQGQSPVLWSTINNSGSAHSVVRDRRTHPHGGEYRDSFEARSPATLDSFCTNITVKPNTYADPDANDTSYGYDETQNNSIGEERHYTTFSGYSFTPDSPAYPPSTRPLFERPKQLAIPPTEYQKHGPKIWSSQNKQYRAGLFPRCFRRFLPRSWKPPEDCKDKRRKRRREQEREMEKIRSNIVIPSPHGPHPPPPRPPRPPASSSPAAPASPALPALTFPEKLNASEYFYELSSTSSDTDDIDRLTPTHAWTGASSSAINLYRGVVDVDGETDIRRARSEAVLGSGPIPAVVDSMGNYWL